MARVFEIGDHVRNRQEAARQEYDLARLHYQAVCDSFDATIPANVERFHSALEMRDGAFERFMAAIL